MGSRKSVAIGVILVVAAAAVSAGIAAGQLPEGGIRCSRTFFSALVQMIPCRTAVAPFSPIPPTEACCSAVIALGHPCLCLLANGPLLSGMDRSLALQLPDRCSANFPPCDVVS